MVGKQNSSLGPLKMHQQGVGPCPQGDLRVSKRLCVWGEKKEKREGRREEEERKE